MTFVKNTVTKSDIIECQEDKIINLIKEIEDLERDYRKLALDSNSLLKALDCKDLTISSLKKKLRWSMPEAILAVIVCIIMVGIGTTL